MKKYLYLLLIPLCIGLVACGDDSDERRSEEGNGGNSNSGNPLIGTWVNTRTGSWGYEKYTYVFKANYTGYSLYDYRDEYGSGNDRVDFSYKIITYDRNTQIGKVQTIHSSGELYNVNFSLSGEELTWDNMVFTKQ